MNTEVSIGFVLKNLILTIFEQTDRDSERGWFMCIVNVGNTIYD